MRKNDDDIADVVEEDETEITSTVRIVNYKLYP